MTIRKLDIVITWGKTNFLNKLCVIVGMILFAFGMWQMDVICLGKIWVGDIPNQYFEMGRIFDFKIGMTLGTGYDLTQCFMVVGFALALLAVWTWHESDKVSSLKKPRHWGHWRLPEEPQRIRHE